MSGCGPIGPALIALARRTYPEQASWLGSWYSTMRQGSEVPGMSGRFVTAEDGVRKVIILNYPA